ncbi:unnamed protein product, partial [marine sediment metagenome]
TEYKGPLPLPVNVFYEKPDCLIGRDVNYGATCPLYSPKEKPPKAR